MKYCVFPTVLGYFMWKYTESAGFLLLFLFLFLSKFSLFFFFWIFGLISFHFSLSSKVENHPSVTKDNLSKKEFGDVRERNKVLFKELQERAESKDYKDPKNRL